MTGFDGGRLSWHPRILLNADCTPGQWDTDSANDAVDVRGGGTRLGADQGVVVRLRANCR